MKRALSFVLVIVGFVSFPGAAHAGPIVPGSLAATEGNGNNGFPFNIGDFGLSSQRYQQVYAASEFSGPIWIDALLFRPDADTGGAFSSTLSNIQIDLSTTSAAPDALSSTFAANVGADNMVVHTGSLALSSSFTGPSGGPKDFDIIVALSSAFFYNPALGNLLLDVRNFGGGLTEQFDAENTVGDSMSRVYTVGSGSSVNDPIASGSSGPSLGLVTQFQTRTTEVVPEPASLLLLATGLSGVALRRRRNRKSNPLEQ